MPRRVSLDSRCGAWLLVSGFEAVDADLMARHRPTLVVSRAIGRGFDALDLAFRLAALGYEGRFVALSCTLPRPALLRREVRRACPGLRFDVVTQAAAGGLRRVV